MLVIYTVQESPVINFDDDYQWNFSLADFPSLVLVFETISPGTQVIFIDEFQNIARCECFICRTHDGRA